MGCGGSIQPLRTPMNGINHSMPIATKQQEGNNNDLDTREGNGKVTTTSEFAVLSNDDNDSLDALETQILSTDKFQDYSKKYPAFAKDLKTVFVSAGKLRKISETENAFYDKSCLSRVNKQVFKLRKKSLKAAFSPGTKDEEKYLVLANFIVEIDGAVLFCKLAQQMFECYMSYLDFVHDQPTTADPTERLGTKSLKMLSESLIMILLIIQNFAEYHEGFCVTCTNTSRLISLCLERSQQLEKFWRTFDNDNSQKVPAIRMMGCSFNIVYNMSRKAKEIKQTTRYEDKQILLHFAKSGIAIVSNLALLSLAYLVDEQSNDLIVADKEILGSFVALLRKAHESERRKFDGFSAKELAEGLSHLAINDTNKKVLGEKGAIPILTEMIRESNDDEERASGVKALWMLAFDEDNSKAIAEEPGALDTLRFLQHSKIPDVQTAAAGALWELEGKEARNEMRKSEGSDKHVMISYQWDAQEVMIEVKNRLQSSGFRVWMDLEHMGGSTLESMAKAVENSSVVLVCVSLKYKESPNCRSEAEYAYQLRKDIIPLMVQRNYTPDGWLGMIVGTKLWIDFKSKHVIESGVNKLIRELGERGRNDRATDVTEGKTGPTTEASDDVDPAESSVPGVSDWTSDDVASWLKEIGMDDVCKTAIPKLDGRTLIYLHELREECPDYYYKCLEGNLNLHDMYDVFTFREELNKVMRI